jgi:hypothetical protein
MKTPAIGEVFGRSWRMAEGEARRDRALILRLSTPDSREWALKLAKHFRS